MMFFFVNAADVVAPNAATFCEGALVVSPRNEKIGAFVFLLFLPDASFVAVSRATYIPAKKTSILLLYHSTLLLPYKVYQAIRSWSTLIVPLLLYLLLSYKVYQAIRSCRGLAAVFLPGASELEKLVTPAEAWAAEACDVLKIKVRVFGPPSHTQLL